MTIPLVDTANDGLDDFVVKYNDLATFLNGIGVGDQFFPATLGTPSAPAYAFTGDLDTGIYSPNANEIGFTLGGSAVAFFNGTGFNVDVNVDIDGQIDVSGQATFQNDVTINGAITGGVNVAGGLTIDDTGITVTTGGVTVTAGGITVTAGGLTIDAGGFDVTGDSTVTGDFNSTGSLTAGTTLDFSTTFAGYARERVRNSFSRVRAYYLASL